MHMIMSWPIRPSQACIWDDLPSLGFESLIDEKSARNNLLSEVSKALNRVQSAIRASVDHVFSCMTMVNGWKDVQKKWDIENRCVVSAQKPHFQLSRYLWLTSSQDGVASH